MPLNRKPQRDFKGISSMVSDCSGDSVAIGTSLKSKQPTEVGCLCEDRKGLQLLPATLVEG